jgi:omega-amidase
LQIHLFDIDIPGEISFKESDTFTAGDKPTIVVTGLHLIISGFYLMFKSSRFYPDYVLNKPLMTTIARMHYAEVGRIGVGICHDIRFPELAMLYRKRGTDQYC